MPLDKNLLSTPAHLGVHKTTSIQTFDLSTLHLKHRWFNQVSYKQHHKQCL